MLKLDVEEQVKRSEANLQSEMPELINANLQTPIEKSILVLTFHPIPGGYAVVCSGVGRNLCPYI